MKQSIYLFLAAILIVGFAACDNEISVRSVTLNKNAFELIVGETERLVATVTPDNAENQQVRWMSSNTAVATVNFNGSVTAVAAGTATITVTTVDGGRTATATVTVSAEPVTSITLTPTTLSLVVGTTGTLTVTTQPANATNQNVTWASNNTSVAIVVDGVVTAVSAGTATITATSVDGNFTATSDIEVDAGVVINGVRWATRNVDAPGTFADAPESTGMLYQWGVRIGWTSTDPLRSSDGSQWHNRPLRQENIWRPQNDPCPKGWRLPRPDEMQVLIDAGHILTTRNGIDGRLFGTTPYQIFLPLVRTRDSFTGALLAGTPTLSYWSNRGFGSPWVTAGVHLRLAGMGSEGSRTGVSANEVFAIRCVEDAFVPATSITLNRGTAALFVGTTEVLIPTITPVNASLGTTWTSNNTAIATVNANGVVTGVSPGTTTIVAITECGGHAAACEVTVSDFPNPSNGVVINGIRWATRNVDAPGTFAPTPESFGMFYQWNRRIAWANTGSVTNWDASGSTGTMWYAENDPCPEGWRIPTEAELRSLANLGSAWTTLNGVRGVLLGTGVNQVFLPAAGWRHQATGGLNWQGSSISYWSSGTAVGLSFSYPSHSRNPNAIDNRFRAEGASIRCVAR